MRGTGRVWCVAWIVATTACGAESDPAAVDAAPNTMQAGLIGRWRSETSADNELELRADGTYGHSITDFNTPDHLQCTDRYRVEGTHIVLDHRCLDPEGVCLRTVDRLGFALGEARLSLAAFRRDATMEDVTGSWVADSERKRSRSGGRCDDPDMRIVDAATLTLSLASDRTFRLQRLEQHLDHETGELVPDESFVDGIYRVDGASVVLVGAPILPMPRLAADSLAPGEDLFGRVTGP